MSAPAGVAANQRLRVLVVDDHEVVQWGFRLMLGSQPWVERCLRASNGEEAAELTRRYSPHVAVVDLFVGSESGPEICERIVETSPDTKVLMISGAGRISDESVRAAGAHGFIPKDLPAGDVAQAVRMTALGIRVYQPSPQDTDIQLSGREQEVLTLVAGGATNREIAASLHLSPHTVKGHTSSLYRKLEAKNRAEAVQRAQRLGLTS